MSAMAQDFWQDQQDDPAVSVEGRIDFRLEDAYWQDAHANQPGYRSECSYEQDYAPAYCVGYIGYAQYGGSFKDAEASLCANWIRIKGDSCLTLEEAMQAIRAAWQHAADGQAAEGQEDAQLYAAAGPRRAGQHAYAAA